MASSFITYALQVDFESVLKIYDHEGMVNTFKALEASGLLVGEIVFGYTPVDKADDLEQWFDRSYVDFVSRDAEQLIVSTSDLDKGTGTAETVAGEQQVPIFVEKGTVAESEGSKDVVVYLFREPIRCRFVKSEYLVCGRDLMSMLVKVPVARYGYAFVFARSGCLRCRLGEEVELVGKRWLIRGFRAVDLMESLAVGQTRVQQSTGQSVDPVPSGTSSSQPSVASQSLSRQRFRPRGRQFKRSSSSSSGSRGSNGARPTASFCGQCGGKNKPSNCIGVRGACNNCGQRSEFQPLETSSVRELSLFEQPGLHPTQVDATTAEFQPLETSSVRELSLFEQPGLHPTQVDATTGERDDILIGGDCTDAEFVRPYRGLVEFSCRIRDQAMFDITFFEILYGVCFVTWLLIFSCFRHSGVVVELLVMFDILDIAERIEFWLISWQCQHELSSLHDVLIWIACGCTPGYLELSMSMLVKVPVARCGYAVVFARSGCLFIEKSIGSNRIDEELMTLDDLLMQISDDMMHPSVTAAEITKIKSDLPVKFKEVYDQDWYYVSLPKISATEKGKAPLEEAYTVKGNPAREMVQLIYADVDFLVQLRQQVMQDVVEFFHYFSINKISDLESLRELAEKEKHMLLWAETDSLETAVKRRVYILAKYREMLLRKFLDSHRKYFTPGQPWTAMASQIIDLLSAAHDKSLDELQAQQQEHGIIMDRPSSSQSFDDTAASSGAVLAQFYSGNDYWRISCRLSIFVNRKLMPERVIEENFVPHVYFIEHVQYWGAAPSIIKSWGWSRVCTEVIRYSMFGYLRPVSRINFCRDIVVHSSAVDVLEKIPNKFCSVFQQDSQDLRVVLSLDLSTSQKKLSTQVAAAALDNVDGREGVGLSGQYSLSGQIPTVESSLG
ncbi:beta-galactosidase 13-like [Dorcoceras hygrometricum]|uniref:Beta-galactosidase 13-like n=1 Tax=Dorcoceras hygrometricum TaxID=472368 RepID=A0A2Z7CT44_9LAMI|nr:beta-galactosidase 13-like [Dorcoceras hygrometricum]